MGPVSPLFIVTDVARSIDHYVRLLGFESRFEGPEGDVFFAIVGRGSAQIMLKALDGTVKPLPNLQRHEWARWDAFVYVDDPDGIHKEFSERGAKFLRPLETNDDKLRGFEVADPDGYVCFFGRPI